MGRAGAKKRGKKERGFLRENLEKEGGFRLGELDFLKERRVFLYSKKLYINPSPLRAKLGA